MGITIPKTVCEPITPDSYRKPEEYVTAWLQETGFLVGNSCYHEALPRELAQALQGRYSPTALAVRHRADRIAAHKIRPVEFLVEVKSPSGWHYANLLLEMLPLAIHIIEQKEIGCECLYVYAELTRQVQHGFWVAQAPKVSQLCIPPRWNQEQAAWYTTIAVRAFGPNVHIKRTRRNKGSGDPFLIISEDDLRSLPDWRDLVRAKIEG